MKVSQVKEELREMREIAYRKKLLQPKTSYLNGYNAGYHKAITDLQRFINLTERIEKVEREYEGK